MPEDNKEHRIIDAALQLFSEQGYHKTTVSQIAQEAEVAKGTVYWYFDSKKDLFRGILISGIEKLHCRVKKTIAKENTAINKLERLVELFLEFFKNGQQVSKMYEENTTSIDAEFKEKLIELREDMIITIATIIEEGKKSGELKSEINNQELANLLLGMTKVYNPHFCNTEFISIDKAQLILDVFLNGIGKE
ncbi:transcriptional regulator [Halobacteroides halobius DSM 5150]|uniref:Transcriptional regulator n=1 Tax=Halobacteroides halobius (strain ATCC 35273 / DSM 5150 / MD-1) TaxID=748449 RepID=L0K8A8_HALHC|nr:TetR/AcrR family transcriptional regulator [Halobacteroides halobius]AGB41517.1 transcriptional regulator [Halobacteroides halobius DSM 5150]